VAHARGIETIRNFTQRSARLTGEHDRVSPSRSWAGLAGRVRYLGRKKASRQVATHDDVMADGIGVGRNGLTVKLACPSR
jgi:hypothetical protein